MSGCLRGGGGGNRAELSAGSTGAYAGVVAVNANGDIDRGAHARAFGQGLQRKMGDEGKSRVSNRARGLMIDGAAAPQGRGGMQCSMHRIASAQAPGSNRQASATDGLFRHAPRARGGS